MFKKYINKFLLLEQAFYQKSVGGFFYRDPKTDMKVFRNLHPKDDFGRSIAQYKCQSYPFKWDVVRLNCISFFFTPVILMALLLKRRSLVKADQSTIVCYNCFNLPDSLPEALSEEDIFVLKNAECPYYLSMTDVPFVLRFCLRSVFHPFLAFRVMLKVAKYRAIIDSFSNLEAIAITGEFVDTSSAMTQYCHERDIKHIDFMQGIAFYSPRASFFHFDKCFVWDQFYRDMYISFGACPEQFVVSIPNGLKRFTGYSIEKTKDFTYYLGREPEEELSIIRTSLDKLVAKGYVCEVRPHPRWSNMETIRRIFDGISIQDTSTVNVVHSILQTKNAISLYSTVLLQAYYNDVNVIIDDLSNPNKFKMLEGYQYIMLNKPHELLSELTRKGI